MATSAALYNDDKQEGLLGDGGFGGPPAAAAPSMFLRLTRTMCMVVVALDIAFGLVGQVCVCVGGCGCSVLGDTYDM